MRKFAVAMYTITGCAGLIVAVITTDVAMAAFGAVVLLNADILILRDKIEQLSDKGEVSR